MIYIDGIITKLQKSGGISVYFNEIIMRMLRDDINFEFSRYGSNNFFDEYIGSKYFVDYNSRTLERYRALQPPQVAGVFHSTYYRKQRRKKLPSVTTVHDFTYEKCIGGIRTSIHSLQKTAAIIEADSVVCISESTRNDLLDLIPKCDPAKVHVIHNGVSPHFKPISKVPINLNIKDSYALFVGARGGYKNFANSVKALSLIENTSLYSVGGGAISRDENALIERYLPGRFYHYDFLSTIELNFLYNQADFLLYPSSYEGFGIPVLEALSAGCPVVAVNASSIPEVSGGHAFLAENSTPEALVAEINKLKQISDISDHVKNGIHWASGFSWEKTYEATMNVYKSLS